MSQENGFASSPRVRDGLKLSDRVQLGAKIGTAVIALTYISGYLTLATYLGRFRIAVDTDSFLRAKYLYVGFEYWFFFVILVVLGIVLFRSIDWFRERTNDEEHGITLTDKQVFRANSELIPEMSKGWRALRWSLVISALLVVLSSNILLASPREILHTLPLEAVLLFHVLLFQTVRYALVTPYRLRSGESVFIWGSLFGKRIAEGLANFSCLVSVCAALLLLAHDMVGKDQWVHKHLGQFRNSSWLYWISAAILIFLDLRALRLLILGYKSFGKIDRSGIWKLSPFCRFVRLTYFGRLTWNRRLRIWLAWLFSLVLLFCAFYSFENDWHSGDIWWLSRACKLVVRWSLLAMILVAIANFWILAQKRAFRMRQRERIMAARGGGPSARRKRIVDEWQMWTLRIAPASALYLVSIFFFASLVYPHIPAEKAGGSPSNPSLRVQIRMMKQLPSGNCPEIPGMNDSSDYAVLEEDNNWIYLIDAKRAASVKTPGEEDVQTYAVRRDCVAVMITNP